MRVSVDEAAVEVVTKIASPQRCTRRPGGADAQGHTALVEVEDIMIPLETSGLASALQGLDVKPDLIADIVDTLTDTGTGLPTGFDQAQLAAHEFGNRPSASTLGLHYNKAYDVMQATIDGIAADLVNFGRTAQVAAQYVDDADTASADDLTRARAAIEDLQTMSKNSQGNQNYDDARNGQPTGRGDR